MNKLKISFNVCLLISLIAFSKYSFSGNQHYEILQASTKQILSQAISDNKSINSFTSETEMNKWLNAYLPVIKNKFPNQDDAREFLLLTHYEATRAGLDPILILGLINIESGFKKYSVSSVGARGLMQVMPFWIDIIGERQHNLFDLKTNLRFGCTILRHYLNIEKGDMIKALARYNGSVGQLQYPNLVYSSFLKYKGLL